MTLAERINAAIYAVAKDAAKAEATRVLWVSQGAAELVKRFDAEPEAAAHHAALITDLVVETVAGQIEAAAKLRELQVIESPSFALEAMGEKQRGVESLAAIVGKTAKPLIDDASSRAYTRLKQLGRDDAATVVDPETSALKSIAGSDYLGALFDAINDTFAAQTAANKRKGKRS